MAKKRTRADNEIYLIGHDSMQLLGAKLPSNRQVLQVLFYCTRQLKFTVEESANIVINEVLIFWAKARIQTSASSYCRKKLINLHHQWRELQKRKSNTSIGGINSLHQFQNKLDDLFDIAHSNANSLMDVDAKKFLEAQRKKGRIGCLVGENKKEAERERKQLEVLKQEERRKAKCKADSLQQCNFLTLLFHSNNIGLFYILGFFLF